VTARSLAAAGLLAGLLVARGARAETPAPAPDEELPRFAVAGPAGFGVGSADGRSMLATHWLLETDFQSFLGANSPPGPFVRSGGGTARRDRAGRGSR
jgi:hypothetical protein